jgi:hypothetical protein
MAKYLLYLLLLLPFLPSQSNAQNNACYCTTPWNGQGYCTANADCWACAPGAYNPSWQKNFCPNYQAPVSCTSTFIERTESCPANYSGAKRSKQETKICTDGQVTVFPWQLFSDTCQPIITIETQTLSCPVHYSGAITQTRTVTAGVPGYWTTTSNTCRQDPPTCQASTQTQTLSCQTGYTGSITQSQTSTCPDPYGSPTWSGAWTTTSNTCVKSLSNPTNVTSPASPISPLNPTSVVSSPAAPQTAVATVSAPTTPDQTSSGGSDAPAPASSATSTPAQPSVKINTPAATTKTQQIVARVQLLSALNIIETNSITQYNVFPTTSFGLNMPEDLIKYQALGLELIQTGMPTIVQDVNKLKENSLEIEQ